MEFTTTPEATMTASEMIQKAQQLETQADNLYMSLLAPSMTERGWRDEAKALREAVKAA